MFFECIHILQKTVLLYYGSYIIHARYVQTMLSVYVYRYMRTLITSRRHVQCAPMCLL